MKYGKLLLTLSVCFIFACVTPVRQVVIKRPIEITNKDKVKPIAITKVAAKMRRGTVLGKLGIGMFCMPHDDIKWKSGGTVVLSSEDLIDVFRHELESNGWPVVGSTDDLFSGYDISGAEVLLGAKIKAIECELCMPFAGFGNFNKKGSMRMDVEWQIYSPARRSLIGKIDTQGSMQITKESDDTPYELLSGSFAIAVNNLIANREFLKMVEKSSGLQRAPRTLAGIQIENSSKNFTTIESAIDYAKKATVTIRTANGHGSGFAIGDGSYIISNSHVVGNAKNITLVTHGGITLNGQVAKMSKERDVALIRIDGLRLPALHVNFKIPGSASPVYAVGSPIREELSSSVTSGIISGIRMIDGYHWIQSDAAVSPGSSGGPLLDKNGSVVGISTAGFQVSGAQVGLNLFVPIAEGLSHIGLRAK